MTKKKKAGRPRIEFDLAAVEGLGRIGATIDDMVPRAARLEAHDRRADDRHRERFPHRL